MESNIKEHRKYNYPRDYTVNQAREIFDIFKFRVFSFKEMNQKTGLDLNDLKHIQMFNCLEKSTMGMLRGGYYFFNKSPHEIIL
jgi:hypothetical protein